MNPVPAKAELRSHVPGSEIPFSARQPGRLKRRTEFLKAASAGRKAAVGGVVLQALPRFDDQVRLGFTVTKKVGNAVRRNRTRRRLKEAARLLLQQLPVQGIDLVLIGRDSTAGRNFTTLQGDIRKALERTGVL
jgi:ribonuclease P protein component